MSTLYNIVKRVINAETNEEAENIFYGKEGIEFDRTEYYRNIVSNFLKKREFLIKKENDMLYFDLNNIHDIWNVIFLAEYIKENDENYKEYKKELIRIEEEQNKAAETINEELRNCNRGTERFIELSKRKSNILKFEKITRIKRLKEKFASTLTIFEPSTNSIILYKDNQNLESIINQLKTKNPDIDEKVFEKLKEAIYILYKLRNTFAHGEEISPKTELRIEKFGFKFNLPISYLDGFNRCKIIVVEKDRQILHSANKKSQPILQYLGYDLKGIESFFYNIEPRLLSYLLDKLEYDYNKLYELPVGAFANYENTTKLIKEYGLTIEEIKQLPDNAFDYPDTVKMLIKEYGFKIDEVKNLPNHAFEYPDSIKILISEYGYSIEDIKKFSKEMFIFPNKTNELIKEYGLTIEEIKKLESSAVKSPNITQILIKKYKLSAEDINAMHHYAFSHPDSTQIIMDEYSEQYKKIRKLSPLLFTYPENLKLIIKQYSLPLETLNCIPLHIIAKPQYIEDMLKKYGFTIEELKDFSDFSFFNPEKTIVLLREKGFTTKEIKEYGSMLIDANSLNIIPNPVIIKKLIKEYGFTLEEIKNLPENAVTTASNVIKLIEEIGISKEEIKNLPNFAFLQPDNIKTLIKEYNIPIEELKYVPEESLMFPENTKKLIKEYGLTYKDLNGLPNIVFISPNIVGILINNYGFTPQTLQYLPDTLTYRCLDQFFNFIHLTKGMDLGPGIYRKLNFENLKEENLKFLIEKVGESYEKLENFPVEFFECDFILLEEMYKRYNSNLNKSIFGINNVKVISLLIYMRSVFGRIDGKEIEVDILDFINKTNYTTIKYKGKMSKINMTQNDFIEQIQNNNLLQKLRNTITHYRFKIIKDENNEENLLYLFDEDNQGIINFNIIININDLLEIIKNIENQLVLQKQDEPKNNRFRL